MHILFNRHLMVDKELHSMCKTMQCGCLTVNDAFMEMDSSLIMTGIIGAQE